MATILLVDDDPNLLTALGEVLLRAGHQVTTLARGGEALHVLEQTPFDVLITDLIMPGKDGIEIIMEVRHKFPGLKIIAISGGGRASAGDYLDMARMLGATLTLAKPFRADDLLGAVDEVLKKD